MVDAILVDNCIPADPDVSGIGVRTAIYAQNFLTFIPAIVAMWDGIVTQKELNALKSHSKAILFTAFAILLSAFVQAGTKNLTGYHTVIVLSLSWMNNTNAIVYGILYIHHHHEFFLSLSQFKKAATSTLTKTTRLNWHTHIHGVFLLGSLHLTLMSVIGLWLWRDITSFGNHLDCTTAPTISVLFIPFPITSPGLRSISFMLYGLLLIPGLNLVLPMASCIAICALGNLKRRHSLPSRIPSGVCLLLIVAIDVIFLVDIELTLRHNKPHQVPGEAVWTFGQSLALLLLFPPLWELIMLLTRVLRSQVLVRQAIRDRGTSNRALIFALVQENVSLVAGLAPRATNLAPPKGGRFQTALQFAAYHGDVDLVKYLTFKRRVNVNEKRGLFGCALQAAAYRGHRDIIYVLRKCGAHVDWDHPLGICGSPLHAAIMNGDPRVIEVFVKASENLGVLDHQGRSIMQLAISRLSREGIISLCALGVSVNLKGKSNRTALHDAVEKSDSEMVEALLERGADLYAEDSNGLTHIGLARNNRDVMMAHAMEKYADERKKLILRGVQKSV